MLFVMLGLLRVLVVKLRKLGAVCCPLVGLLSDLLLRHLLLPQHLLLFLLLLSILHVLATLDVPPQIVEVVRPLGHFTGVSRLGNLLSLLDHGHASSDLIFALLLFTLAEFLHLTHVHGVQLVTASLLLNLLNFLFAHDALLGLLLHPQLVGFGVTGRNFCLLVSRDISVEGVQVCGVFLLKLFFLDCLSLISYLILHHDHCRPLVDLALTVHRHLAVLAILLLVKLPEWVMI